MRARFSDPLLGAESAANAGDTSSASRESLLSESESDEASVEADLLSGSSSSSFSVENEKYRASASRHARYF